MTTTDDREYLPATSRHLPAAFYDTFSRLLGARDAQDVLPLLEVQEREEVVGVRPVARRVGMRAHPVVDPDRGQPRRTGEVDERDLSSVRTRRWCHHSHTSSLDAVHALRTS